MKNSLRKGDDKSAINLIELTDLVAHAIRKRLNIYIAMHATAPHPIRSHICRVLAHGKSTFCLQSDNENRLQKVLPAFDSKAS